MTDQLSDVPDAGRVAQIAAEVAAVCRPGLANIEIDSKGGLVVQAPAIEHLAHEYCLITKSRHLGSAEEVQKLLHDGLNLFSWSRPAVEYKFIRMLSFGPAAYESRKLADADLTIEESRRSTGEAWAIHYPAYVTDYVIDLLTLVGLVKKRRRKLRLLLWSGGILLLLTIFDTPFFPGDPWTDLALRLLAGIGVVLCAWFYTKESYVRELKHSSVRRTLGREVEFLPPRSALALQLRAGTVRPVEPLEAEIFALAIIEPASLRQRISERYEPGRRTLWQQVNAAIQIPGQLIDPEGTIDGPDGPRGASEEEAVEKAVKDRKVTFQSLGQIPFPVVIPPKGYLNDELVILDSSGERLSCFSYSEYLLIVASVLRMLLLKAYNLHNADQLPRKSRDAERKALACIMQRGAPSMQEIEKAVESIVNLSIVTDENEPKCDSATLGIAGELVRKLSGRYAIVAPMECTPEGRMTFEYRRRIVPVLELGLNQNGIRLRWVLDRLSILLGARPVDLTVPLENAPTCQSFHVDIDCPEGLYLRNQQLPGIDEYLNRFDRQTATVPPYYRLRRRLGQPYAHLYARAFPAPREGEVLPEFKVSFWEVPPGSLFRAAVVAVSTALLVWLVGWVLPRASNPGTDVPAVILAFPAIAAAWLGFDEKRRRLLEGTLLSRLSLLLSATLALAASGLFMLNSAKLPLLHDSIPFPITVSFLGIHEASWGILVCLSLINSLTIGYVCLLRTWEFRYLAARPDPMSSVREG